jgi:hypothetical protein
MSVYSLAWYSAEAEEPEAIGVDTVMLKNYQEDQASRVLD